MWRRLRAFETAITDESARLVGSLVSYELKSESARAVDDVEKARVWDGGSGEVEGGTMPEVGELTPA
jgi:hypothetical protein